VSSERGYGLPVDTDGVTAALESTRLLRLALNSLWNQLPGDLNQAGPVQDALKSIHDQINEVETADLRRYGIAEHYLIIRPVSLVSPPPPHIMEKITAAVRTLAELGMLAGQSDALERD
jgi:hypothetical protein